MSSSLSRRRAARRGGRLGVAVTLASIAAFTSFAGTAQAADSTSHRAYRSFGANCPATIIYGVRGVGEQASKDSLGDTIYSIYTETKSLTGRTATGFASAIGYAANQYTSASKSALVASAGAAYADSVLPGVDYAVTDLISLHADCARSSIVAIGYSEGADVLRRAFNLISETVPAGQQFTSYTGITAYLLGDPNFDSKETEQSSGDFGVSSQGLLTHAFLLGGVNIKLSAPPAMPSTLGWWTYCHALDPVCQTGYDLSQHMNYPPRDGYGIAARIAEKHQFKVAATPEAFISRSAVCGVNGGQPAAQVYISMLDSNYPNPQTFTFYRDNTLIGRLTLAPRTLPATPVQIAVPSFTPAVSRWKSDYTISVRPGPLATNLWQRRVAPASCIASGE